MSARVTNEDLPERYRSANAAAMQAERVHVRLLAVSLGAVVLAAVVSLLPKGPWLSGPVQAAVVGALFGVSAVVGIMTGVRELEERWYKARAVAESVKSLAWKYMMRAEPFMNGEQGDNELEALFLSRVREVSASLKGTLPSDPAEAIQITQVMRSLREASLEGRLATYKQDRLDEQFGWYTRKANWNRALDRSWSTGILGGQILIVFLIGVLWLTDASVRVVAALGTAVASAIAWAQLKRFRELKVAYEVAARDLEELKVRAGHVSDDPSLEVLVNEVESAISREHTLWVARRTT